MEYFYVYNAHTSLNAQAEMIASVVVTAGNAYDGHQSGALVARDRRRGVVADTYAGDRGCNDSENPCLVKHLELKSTIILNNYRTKKKDKNK